MERGALSAPPFYYESPTLFVISDCGLFLGYRLSTAKAGRWLHGIAVPYISAMPSGRTYES